MSEQVDKLQLGSVAFFPDGVAEMDRHRRVVFVPRDKLRGLTLAFGSGAEQPFVVLLVALVALAISVYPVVVLVNRLIYGGVISAKVLWWCAFFPLVPWLLQLALKRRFIVIAHTERGTRKLILGDVIARESIEPFLADVSSRLGYSIDIEAAARQELSNQPRDLSPR